MENTEKIIKITIIVAFFALMGVIIGYFTVDFHTNWQLDQCKLRIDECNEMIGKCSLPRQDIIIQGGNLTNVYKELEIDI